LPFAAGQTLPMPPPSPQATPISLDQRIVFIDVLRGLALFGILAANMRAFVAPLDAYQNIGVLFPGRADLVAQAFIDTFFQGKFISIFSFLFGMGFAMQMSRAEARGASFLRFYPRRLLALALFGVIHGILIWAGDILLTYALAGAILLLFRHRRQKILLYWAGSLLCAPIIVSAAMFVAYHTSLHRKWMDPKPPDLAKLHKIIDIYAHGPVSRIAVQNWTEWRDQLPFELFAIYASALFLLGIWTWRAGIVQRLPEFTPVLRRVAAWCLPAGIAISLYVALIRGLTPPTTVSVWAWFAAVLWLPGSHILAAGYMAGLALLFQQPRWRARLLPFAAVGRMALTDYLMQSVLCTLLFDATITGLYGRIGPAAALIPTVILFVAQVAFSNWWLARYRFGPMEYLWRILTYGKMPPLRKLDQEQGLYYVGR
jgi:uncharacterized protein